MEVSEELRSLLVGDAQQPEAEEQNPSDETESLEAQAENVEGETEDAQEQPEAEQEYELLNELLDSQEIDKDWFYNRKVKIASQGDDPAREVTLSEALNQLQDVERREQTLRTREAEFDQQLRGRMQQQMPDLSPELLQAHGQLESIQQQYNSIDQRDDLDPGEKANAKLQLGTAYQQIQGQISELKSKAQEAQQAAVVEAMNRRNQVLLQEIDSWRDPKVMEQESKSIYEFAQPFGFSPQEIMTTNDPRVILLLRHATELAGKLKASEEVGKRVRRAPKMGGAKARGPNNSAQKIAAIEKFAKSDKATSRDKPEAQKALLQQAGII